MVSDFWFLVSGSRLLVSGFWVLVPGIWFLISYLWLLVSGFWFLVSDVWFMIYSFWLLVSHFWFLISGSWFLVSDFWFLISGPEIVGPLNDGIPVQRTLSAGEQFRFYSISMIPLVPLIPSNHSTQLIPFIAQVMFNYIPWCTVLSSISISSYYFSTVIGSSHYFNHTNPKNQLLCNHPNCFINITNCNPYSLIPDHFIIQWFN